MPTLEPGWLAPTGALSQACNWEVSFVSADEHCQVSAQVKSASNAAIGSAVLTTANAPIGLLTLQGTGTAGATSALTYQGTAVGAIDFTVTQTCASFFTPTVDVQLPPDCGCPGRQCLCRP